MARTIENSRLRVTVLVEGGHVAEIACKQSGINPLWTPPWPSIEPSRYNLAQHPEYGADAESKLLAGIMGHNVCLDTFGGVTGQEAAAGLTVHGEAPVARYEIGESEGELAMHARFPESQLRFERHIRLRPGSAVVFFEETVENLAAIDRPIAWTQHVTLGPPFLEKGATRFAVTATRSKVYDADFGSNGHTQTGAEFDWPNVPLVGAGVEDLRVFTGRPHSGGYTAHLMDVERPHASFAAWSPTSHLAFGYVWRRDDFPWLGIWEENYNRTGAPWNGRTLTRGMEFGASPMPETRRAMITRGSLFGVPGYRWVPARSSVHVTYRAALSTLTTAPGALEWSDTEGARFA
jgi:hypothetical protein